MGNSNYITSLNGLRGFAAVLILMVQFVPFFPVLKTLHLPTNNYLWADFFFILSGFVITLNYGNAFENGFNKDAYKTFLRRRLTRLYPFYAVALVGMILAELYRMHVYTSMHTELVVPIFNNSLDGEKSWPNLVLSFLMLQSWGVHKSLVWNVPAWAVSALFFVYILFPVLLSAILKLRSNVIVFGILMLGYFLVDVFDSYHNPYNFNLLHALLGFSCGIALARAYVTNSGNHKLLRNDWLLGLLLMACIYYTSISSYTFPIFPMFCLLVHAVARSEGKVAGALNSKPLQFLGNISYGLYLTHFVVLNFLDMAILSNFNRSLTYFPLWQNGLLFIAFLGVTIGVSMLGKRYLEKSTAPALSA